MALINTLLHDLSFLELDFYENLVQIFDNLICLAYTLPVTEKIAQSSQTCLVF